MPYAHFATINTTGITIIQQFENLVEHLVTHLY